MKYSIRITSLKMIKEIKEKFPEWVNDTTTDYSLCLSNDLDSLLSCTYLKQIKGYDISHFYNFKEIREKEGHINKPKSLIGVDLALENGKVWDNHVTMFAHTDSVNPQSANLNAINKIHRGSYFDKFSGSTLLQIMSYYDVDISTLSEEAKMILLCIDGAYIPFFPRYIDFSGTMRNYLKQLEYEELIDVVKRHKQQDFRNIVNKYNLNANINTKNKYLTTNIDLAGISEVFSMQIELPDKQFKLVAEFETDARPLPKGYYLREKPTDVFNLAVTNRDFYCSSTLILN